MINDLSKKNGKVANEGLLQTIFNKIRGVPSKQECLDEYKNLKEQINKLAKDSEINRFLRFYNNSKEINNFCDPNKDSTIVRVAYLYESLSKKDKQLILKYDKLFRSFVNDLSSKIRNKKFGIQVFDSIDYEDGYYSIDYTIYLAQKWKNSVYVPIKSENNFNSEEESKVRKNMVNLYKNLFTTVLSKYSDIKKGFSVDENASNEIEKFINGIENKVFLHSWNIWDITENARDDEVYERIMEKKEAFLKELINEFDKKKDNNFYIITDDDWDDGFIGIETRTTKKGGKESFGYIFIDEIYPGMNEKLGFNNITFKG